MNVTSFAEDRGDILNSSSVLKKLIRAFSAKELKKDVRLNLVVDGGKKVRLNFNESNFFEETTTLLLTGKSYTVARNRDRSSRLRASWASGTFDIDESGIISLDLSFPYKTKNAIQYYKLNFQFSNFNELLNQFKNRAPNFALAGKTCAEHGELHLGGEVSSFGTENVSFETLPATYREYEVSIDSDPQFAAFFGGNTVSQMTSILNTASSIYQSQLGIKLQPRVIRTERSSSVYVAAGSSSTPFSTRLLENFQNVELNRQILGSPDVYFLFSGQDFEGGVVGLAYLGPACLSIEYSFGTMQHINSALNPIIFAHELGHTLDASHGSGSGTTGIMSPVLSSPAPETFSTLSRNEINAHVTSHGSCLATVNDSSPTPTPNPTATPIPNVPTATPTPISGGGGGGNSGGGGTPVSPAIDLSARISRNLLYGVVNPGNYTGDGTCSMFIRVGNSYFGARTGRVIGGTLSSFNASFSQTLTSKAKKRTSERRRVYLVAEHSCSGMTSSFSESKRINPFSVRASRRVSLSQWMRELAVGF